MGVLNSWNGGGGWFLYSPAAIIDCLLSSCGNNGQGPAREYCSESISHTQVRLCVRDSSGMGVLQIGGGGGGGGREEGFCILNLQLLLRICSVHVGTVARTRPESTVLRRSVKHR